ncbi:MAG TPA: hypothetical protein VMW16_13895 [Sedimentisphaerales bacterium]|nr:hypothetical protein [Sedimentisphaerales bacterium]
MAVSERGDSSVNCVVSPSVRCENYRDVYFDVPAKITLSLDQNHITKPFTHGDVHVQDGGGKEHWGVFNAEKVASR